MKTNELTGAALDWAVAQCEGLAKYIEVVEGFKPSTDWAQSGAIIEREKIELEHDGFEWWARIKSDDDYNGETPLIAAMRCYVASKLGNDVQLPEGLA